MRRTGNREYLPAITVNRTGASPHRHQQQRVFADHCERLCCVSVMLEAFHYSPNDWLVIDMYASGVSLSLALS